MPHHPKSYTMLPSGLILPQAASATVLPVLAAFSIIVLVFVCIVAFSVVTSFTIIIFIYAVCHHFFTPDRHWLDLEAGDEAPETGILASRRRERNRDAQRNVWLEVLERTMEAIEERRGLRRREAVKRMPSPVSYADEEMATKGSECAICLEDFVREEVCQVFPVCNHIFHFSCIQHWLKRNLTCPICRSSILEE